MRARDNAQYEWTLTSFSFGTLYCHIWQQVKCLNFNKSVESKIFTNPRYHISASHDFLPITLKYPFVRDKSQPIKKKHVLDRDDIYIFIFAESGLQSW